MRSAAWKSNSLSGTNNFNARPKRDCSPHSLTANCASMKSKLRSLKLHLDDVYNEDIFRAASQIEQKQQQQEEEIIQLRDHNAALEQENALLRQQMENLENTHAKYLKLKKLYNGLVERHNSLNRQWISQQAIQAELESSFEQVQSKVEQLEESRIESVEELEERHRSLQEELVEARERVALQGEELQQMYEQRAELVETVKACRLQAIEHEQSIAQQLQAYRELQSKHEIVSERLHMASEQLQLLEQRRNECLELREQLSVTKEALEEERGSAQRLRADIAMIEARHQTLQQELVEVRERAAQQSEELRQVHEQRAGLVDAIAALEAHLQGVAEEQQMSTVIHEQLRNQLLVVNERVQQLHQENEELEAQLATRRGRIRALKKLLKNSSSTEGTSPEENLQEQLLASQLEFQRLEEHNRRREEDLLALDRRRLEAEQQLAEAKAQLAAHGWTPSCVVCSDHMPEYAVMPCVHLCLCERCLGMSQPLLSCPMCAGPADQTIRVFMV